MQYTKNLIDLIKNYNHKKKYSSGKQKKVFYFCCMVGGYESYDKLVHLLVNKLRYSIKVNLSLYYPFEVDINKRIDETELMYNKNDISEIYIYLNNIKNTNEKSSWNTNIDSKWKEFFNISMIFRGFNERINYNKIYVGNFACYKRVLNYFINDVDINIINKLRSLYGDDKMETLLRTYFQIPQLMHPDRYFWYNYLSVLLNENICVDFKNKYHNYNIDCKKRDNNFISNLTTTLIYYGDCREAALILIIYKSILEWEKFIDLLNNKDFKLIDELIINQTRLISTNIYINSDLYYVDYIKYPKYYFNFKVLNKNSIINKKMDTKIIKNNI
jgi:hypothetical protein